MAMLLYTVCLGLGILPSVGSVCATGSVPHPPAVQPVVPVLDPHRDRQVAWTSGVASEHASSPQGSPRYVTRFIV